MLKRVLKMHLHESELQRLLNYLSTQNEAAEQRINKLFCCLIHNSWGGLSVKWCPKCELEKILDAYTLIGVHASSGFPILERKKHD